MQFNYTSYAFYPLDSWGKSTSHEFLSQPLPWKPRGFGTYLALMGEAVVQSRSAEEGDVLLQLQELLVDLFTCLSGRANPREISVLGMFLGKFKQLTTPTKSGKIRHLQFVPIF